MGLTHLINDYLHPKKVEALKAESQSLSNRLALDNSSRTITDSSDFNAKAYLTTLDYTRDGLLGVIAGIAGLGLFAVDSQFHDTIAKAAPGLPYLVFLSKMALTVGGTAHGARNLSLIRQLSGIFPEKEKAKLEKKAVPSTQFEEMLLMYSNRVSNRFGLQLIDPSIRYIDNKGNMDVPTKPFLERRILYGYGILVPSGHIGEESLAKIDVINQMAMFNTMLEDSVVRGFYGFVEGIKNFCDEHDSGVVSIAAAGVGLAATLVYVTYLSTIGKATFALRSSTSAKLAGFEKEMKEQEAKLPAWKRAVREIHYDLARGPS
jgi:hypothetical protein